MSNIMGPQWLLDVVIFLFVIVFLTWPMCRICSKAGYAPSLGLLTMVPFAIIGLVLFLAFVEWPIQRAAEDRA